MLRGYFQVLDDLLKSTESASTLIKKLEEEKIKVEKYIAQYEEELINLKKIIEDRKNKGNAYYNRVFDDAAYDTSLAAPEILQKTIVEAAQSAPEYLDPILLRPLLEVATYLNIFNIRENRAGINSTITCEINFEEQAGDLEDWAQAVKDVRQQLGSPQKNPSSASAYWRTKVYHKSWPSGSYEETIGMRLQSAGKLAPYWQLLNDGNSIRMSSDWGGTAYPTNGPTRFIQEAEGRVENYFFDAFHRRLGRADQQNKDDKNLIEKFRAALKKLYDYAKKIDDLINELNNLNWETPYFIDTGTRRLTSVLESEGKSVDINKVVKAIQDIISGVEKERFEIGLPGRRVRIRPTRLLELVYGGG